MRRLGTGVGRPGILVREMGVLVGATRFERVPVGNREAGMETHERKSNDG